MSYFFRRLFDCLFLFVGFFSSFLFVSIFFYLMFSISKDASKAFVKSYISIDCPKASSVSCLLFEYCPALSEEEIEEIFYFEAKRGKIGLKIFEKDSISSEQYKCIEFLKKKNKIEKSFNKSFFTNVDSTDCEDAGILTCLVGTLYSCVIASIFSFVSSVTIGSCLFYFNKKNVFLKFVDFNIKILASIPPIMIGIFCSFFFVDLLNVPRSSSLIAGIVLGTSVFPMMTICVKQSIASISNSVRFGGLAIGASEFQVFTSLILPNALKKIFSGMLIATSRVVGETTPMLAVGMVIFVKEIPKDVFDPTTTLPTQVFLWLKNNSVGFAFLASAGILVLLFIITLLNVFSFFANKEN